MSETNKSYRIRTNTNITEGNGEYLTINADLVQDYDAFDILSVSLNSVDTYKLHNANYGVVVGRVLANNGFGIPNAKISIFIEKDDDDSLEINELYPYNIVSSKNSDGVRYNLLPDEMVKDCHQTIGTFPNKRYVLDNDALIEVFDKYYKYTTKTNNSGDYLLCGVPTGTQTLHMDLDLSDCGILSQRPRDFVYKGYTIEQFENPNMFKTSTNLSSLSQVFSQDRVVYVQPFWGNTTLGETIGITRADIDVSFKFEPTCVFMGSVISDSSSKGISAKCVPTDHMGDMDELVTGEGTIEMIRKTPGGSVEEFQIKGTQLIDANGIWCYQIPMNLDYMMTDEYGNMVPTDDPSKGIPTRTRVRFRISMEEGNDETAKSKYFRAKALVPNNPQMTSNGGHEEYDYEFGTYTKEESYRDLFWNNVYSVKSFIPRIQRKRVKGWDTSEFTGIKHCNYYGANNPMPYNNIRIKLPFMFTVMCAIIKCFIFLTGVVNTIISMLGNVMADLGNTRIPNPLNPLKVKSKKKFPWVKISVNFIYPFKSIYKWALKLKMSVLKDGLCPDLDNWYFAPMYVDNRWTNAKPPSGMERYNLLQQTLNKIKESGDEDDPYSIDDNNKDEEDDTICLTTKTDYLLACIEMNLAQEYKVINFDFYNDWVNGTIYFPRWRRYIRPKRRFLGIKIAKTKVKGCMDDTKIFSKSRYLTQQCTIGYKSENVEGNTIYTNVADPIKSNLKLLIRRANNSHKKRGLKQKSIFGKHGGLCHEHNTLKGQNVYYLKPCEWLGNLSKANLFATDVILLGSLNDCDLNGIPQAFRHLTGSSYIMPTNLALTNMETSGPLYANSKNTLCAGTSNTTENDVLYNDNGVNVLDTTTNPLSTELAFYSGANSSNYDTVYETDEPSDTIAMTEAAGISWNWTGPGQGGSNDYKMYNPGGHFLGLSCVNSQTNLKSCINLSRICELGASMSQRKEDIRSFDENGNPKYTYSVPTGFISGDEIVDSDFRTMFATMNQNRLLATKRNLDTGYKCYDFTFLKPINFNGAFQNVTIKGENYYNNKIEVQDESQELSKYGITNGANRDDYDSEETSNTQTRTIENPSLDYYLFRMGLNINQLSTREGLQKRHFLHSDGKTLYMPQYENSYYFYFGMHNGATALDEFNKQFFSECQSNSLIGDEPKLDVSATDIDACNGNGTIEITLNNIETPLQKITYDSDSDNIPPMDITEEYKNNLIITLTGMPFGNYTVYVEDANNNEYTETVSLGTTLITCTNTVSNFNYEQKPFFNGKYEGVDNIFKGGYITVSDIYFPLMENTDLTITLENYLEGTTIPETIVENVPINDNENEIVIGVKNANKNYRLFAKYKCEDSDNYVSILLSTYKVNDGSSVRLRCGEKNGESVALIGMRDNETHSVMTSYSMNEEWWSVNALTANTVEKWILRKCLCNGYNDDTFSNNVFAENGTKVLWGTPQNSSKMYESNNIYCEEDILTLPNGYSLDDDASYHSTYNASGYTKCKQYCSIAYDDTTVSGSFVAIYENGTCTVINDNWCKNNIRIGYGAVLKDIENDNLYFGIWGGTDTNVEFLVMNNGEYVPFMQNIKGIIYSACIYPVIKRPFYADINIFTWQDKELQGNTAEGYEFEEVDKGLKVEGDVHNGLTYDYNGKRSFDTNSEISLENSSSLFDISQDDMINITPDGVESHDRLVPLSLYKDTDGLDEYYYTIIEGHPSTVTSNMYSTISDSVGSNFFDNFKFVIEDGSGLDTKPTLRVYGVGDSSNEVVYYVCNQTALGSLISNSTDGHNVDNLNFIQRDGYIYQKVGKYEHKVPLCYTDKASHNQEGDELIGRFDSSDGRLTWDVNEFDVDEGIVVKTKDERTCENNNKRSDVNYCLNLVYNDIFKGENSESAWDKFEATVKPFRNLTFNENPTYTQIMGGTSKSLSWEDAIKLSTYDSYPMNDNELTFNQSRSFTGDGTTIKNFPYKNGDIVYFVGVLKGSAKDETQGNTSLYKIYLQPIKTSTFIERDTYIYASPKIINAPREGGIYEVVVTGNTYDCESINARKPIIIKGEDNYGTMSYSYTPAIDYTKSTFDIKLTIKVNKCDGDERYANIYFYYNSLKDGAMVTVLQDGGQSGSNDDTFTSHEIVWASNSNIGVTKGYSYQLSQTGRTWSTRMDDNGNYYWDVTFEDQSQDKIGVNVRLKNMPPTMDLAKQDTIGYLDLYYDDNNYTFLRIKLVLKGNQNN